LPLALPQECAALSPQTGGDESDRGSPLPQRLR
jgi:hypothetical protein